MQSKQKLHNYAIWYIGKYMPSLSRLERKLRDRSDDSIHGEWSSRSCSRVHWWTLYHSHKYGCGHWVWTWNEANRDSTHQTMIPAGYDTDYISGNPLWELECKSTKRYENSSYDWPIASQMRRCFTHSYESPLKISRSTRYDWEPDSEYRWSRDFEDDVRARWYSLIRKGACKTPEKMIPLWWYQSGATRNEVIELFYVIPVEINDR
jgi:hypothetical protein